MNDDRKEFFEDVAACYRRENQDISWSWEDISSNKMSEEIVFYLAFNLSKNIIHGPLPDRLHNRMILEQNGFSRAYCSYLGGGK